MLEKQENPRLLHSSCDRHSKFGGAPCSEFTLHSLFEGEGPLGRLSAAQCDLRCSRSCAGNGNGIRRSIAQVHVAIESNRVGHDHVTRLRCINAMGNAQRREIKRDLGTWSLEGKKQR